ncbi:hypothetical protein A7K93_08110 [Candidatus Methylacidiphilum fumarolicum]|uniref:Polysaccharide biosynthesis protein n=2 Tax=Candidatus Methylacidiphilum fumarolicum TaxID=591154 RepID=I0JYC8_METFB|nr:hypothetical protein [Candidatus Methylacidiphilum fumarolicum]MBW6415969.1 hypothetical protein [Candidatus Methylacidiphilum fumarolicum]TFE67258.1 hypothetical protein A7K73_09355 [Candidatus Methylacidiphilum fumarolicum]TFE71767.1 hypothetical protein A7K72_10155 [Candidatus Methylacidiphilum fumarolicum]TFE72753.1 hypothetical protein A7K93_08110 [Candidatus Methylacidiphilum fumarolicum]TFE76259.1 hypothetical protein A7D33_10545 [Candidatus Methylacidiphilum fumarolicum]
MNQLHSIKFISPLQFYDKLIQLLKKHFPALIHLWSSSGIVSLANAISIFLLVTKCPKNIFASYAIAQAISFLVNAWTDGGISLAIQILAAQDANNKIHFENYKKESLRLSLRIFLVMGFSLWGIIYFFHNKGKFFEEIPLALISSFFLVGLFQTRQSFCLSFLYALGRFNHYSWLQTFSPLFRLVFLIIILYFIRYPVNLITLLSLDLVAYGLGWFLSGSFLRKIQNRLLTNNLNSNAPIPHNIRQELWKFVFPSLQTNVLLSLVHWSGTLFGALFATDTVVAIYSIFQRCNQIFMLAIGPINNYIGRRLRLIRDVTERVSKAKKSLFFIASVYPFLSFFLYGVYIIGSKHFHHYVFEYPNTFIIFLITAFFGIIYSLLDIILSSWGQANHRFISSWILAGKILIFSFLQPKSAALLLIVDGSFLVLIDIIFILIFVSFIRNKHGLKE